MSKETSMTIRVEPDLRERFAQATKANRRPAAQVIRDFMYKYVELADREADSVQRVSAAEQERRRSDFDAAVASVALEGLTVPAAYREEADRFIRGEIEFDELTTKVHEMAQAR